MPLDLAAIFGGADGAQVHAASFNSHGDGDNRDGGSPHHGRVVIFQDVDGVLNHSAGGDGTLDPALLRNLGELVRRTGATIVISSAWRKHPQALKWLIREGLKNGAGIPEDRIIGTTPSFCAGVDCRAAEIRSWLEDHPEVLQSAKWAAIDDQDVGSQDPEFMRGHFVRTDARKGLTHKKAEEALRLLQAASGPQEGSDPAPVAAPAVAEAQAPAPAALAAVAPSSPPPQRRSPRRAVSSFL